MTGNDYKPLLKPMNGNEIDALDPENQEIKINGEVASPESPPKQSASITEKATPEWAVLLLGCALGLLSGASVVLFNLVVHGIHELAWAGTPTEGAAWLRIQPLTSIWHRIMLIPVLGGIVVGILHALSGIIEQSQSTISPISLRGRVDWSAVSKPVVKAVQAAVTLGTGSSLGPEGPSVDIGKAWANGLAELFYNTKERKTALIAAGAAAGIASGFNAAVAGCFFAIETVLQPSSSENAPPLTTAMIILASVLSSTVSNVVLGEEPAFTVPEYELKSAAELPLYLLLGMVCGIISVILTRLIKWSSDLFDFLRDKLGIPSAVTPALGGLCVGFIALQYPGVLYWGFSNVNEILHSRLSASAPGPKLMTQLIAAKIVATALCRGSGLVGGIYAPSLFIGSAVGSVYGSLAGAFINAAIPGQAEVAAPQAYALVGMAAMLASVCSVPLTSVLLLFELTKDYHILLPLMGAVGLAYWVSSVANRKKSPPSPSRIISSNNNSVFPYSPIVHAQSSSASPLSPSSYLSYFPPSSSITRRNTENNLELCSMDVPSSSSSRFSFNIDDRLLDEIKVSSAMITDCVRVPLNATVKEAMAAMLEKKQGYVVMVDGEGLVEGILTMGDLQHEIISFAVNLKENGEEDGLPGVDSTLVASFCNNRSDSHGHSLIVCYPDCSLRDAIHLMDPYALHQLPVVARVGKRWQERGRKLLGIVDRESIGLACQTEMTKRILSSLPKSKDSVDISINDHGSNNGH